MSAQLSIMRALGRAGVIAVAALVASPILAAAWGALSAEGSLDTLFAGPGWSYATATLLLCLFAGAGAAVIGAGAAALIALTEFPGRRFLAVGLALPFAIPAYIAAYAYGDVFSPFGPAAAIIGVQNLPAIRTLPGAALILALATYPYVYLAMTASLRARSSALMEAARMLGASPASAARQVLIAAGRPALAGGLALALMEIAAEYGVADYFGVPTLSVGIFRTWHGIGDLGGATQLAMVLFVAALLFVGLEEAGRSGAASERAYVRKAHSRIALSAPHAACVLALLSLPVILGFLLPAGVLLSKLGEAQALSAYSALGSAVLNTALVAGIGALIALALAGLLAYAGRQAKSGAVKVLLRIATLGYAVPGAVIAIGLLALAAMVSGWLGAGTAGGLVILIYAYCARFLTAAYNAIEGGMAQINPQMDEAAQMLGAGAARIAGAIHLPQLRGAIAAGGAIVAIDIAKELPATLLLRPFNFETLATRVYRLASDERLADAAPAGLLLIVMGLIPVLMISRTLFKRD